MWFLIFWAFFGGTFIGRIIAVVLRALFYTLISLATIFCFFLSVGYIGSKIFVRPEETKAVHSFVFPTFVLSTVKGWQHVGCDTQEHLDAYHRYQERYEVARSESLIKRGTCQRLEDRTGVFVLQSHFGVVKVEEVDTKQIYWAKEEAINAK